MIIGVMGPIGSGKDLVGELVLRFAKRYANKWFKVKKFAEPIKKGAAAMLGVAQYRFEDRRFKNEPLEELDGKTPRELMQLLGTEFGRNLIHPDVWVRLAMKGYNKDKDWIFTDVRFENEVKAIRKAGGVIWKIKGRGEYTDKHESEEFSKNFRDADYNIDNSTTIAALEKKISDELHRILK